MRLHALLHRRAPPQYFIREIGQPHSCLPIFWPIIFLPSYTSKLGNERHHNFHLTLYGEKWCLCASPPRILQYYALYVFSIPPSGCSLRAWNFNPLRKLIRARTPNCRKKKGTKTLGKQEKWGDCHVSGMPPDFKWSRFCVATYFWPTHNDLPPSLPFPEWPTILCFLRPLPSSENERD